MRLQNKKIELEKAIEIQFLFFVISVTEFGFSDVLGARLGVRALVQ